jgi:lambda family phage portal protein
MAAFSRAGDRKVVQLHNRFEAGERGRRLRAIPTTGLAINSTIRAYGKNVVARSRYLAVNNPYASLAKEEFVASFVGDGIKPSWNIDDVKIKRELQELWLEWTDEADADNLTDFYGLQNIIAGEMFEAGECFVRIRPRYISDGLSVPMQLQILPSEMLPYDLNMSTNAGLLTGNRDAFPSLAGGGNARVECGVQFDSIGRRVGYWFYKNHPNELNFNNTGGSVHTFVPADQILHLFKPIRAGQIRGVPHTLAGIVTCAMLDLYDDAELERKRTAALFTAFVTQNANEEEGDNPLGGGPSSPHRDKNGVPTGQNDVGLEPGATVTLDEGQSVKFADPADVGGNYEAFQYRSLLRASAGFGTPYAQATGDLRGSSYGSQRGGMITFKRRISMMQNSVMIFQFCRPIKNAWLKAAVLADSFETFSASDYAKATRKFQKVRWITPKWDWIDPLKDLTAEKLAVDSGFKPRSDVVEAMGYDAEEVDEQIARDQKRAERLGLKFTQLQTTTIVSPTSEETEPENNSDSLIDPNSNSANEDPNTAPKPSPKPKPAKKSAKASVRYEWDC